MTGPRLPLILGAALSLALSAVSVAQTPKAEPDRATGEAGQRAATPGAQPSAATPSGGKTSNRAAPIEPPAQAAEPPPVGRFTAPALAPAAAPNASPPAAAPVGAAPQIPVFANPGAQGFSRTAPAVQAPKASAPPEEPAWQPKPGEDDWRASKQAPEPAFGAFQRGHYVAAMREALKTLETDKTNAAAMTLIGELYRDGLGVRQNPAEALRWYRLADQRGDRQAAFAIARAYILGAGVAQDYAKAREFLDKAAAKDHGAALYNLGVMAIEGEIQDYHKAAELFRRAREQGDLDATYSLAFLYRAGQGVAQDDKLAAELLREAADQHHLPAMVDYAITLFNGRGVDPDEPGAASYLLRAAWRNAPVAQNRLARMYVAGRGVRQDLVEAMKWHILARANGLKDEFLDAQLPKLTASQREIVEEAVRKFAVK